jgi:hypothetical protein
VLADHILKGAQVGPASISQGQVDDVTHPDLVGLYRLRLVEQLVWRAAQPVGGIGRAQGEGFRVHKHRGCCKTLSREM